MNIPFKISENDSFLLVAGESEYKVLHHAFNFGLSIQSPIGSRSIHVLGVYLHYLSCMSPTKTAGESIFLSILLQDVICKGNPMLFGSVAKSCPTFCNHVACTTPDFPVLHYLLEFAQIHAHWVGDAIQPSHPVSPSSPPAFSLSQHQGLLHGRYTHFLVLPVNMQDWFPLG